MMKSNRVSIQLRRLAVLCAALILVPDAFAKPGFGTRVSAYTAQVFTEPSVASPVSSQLVATNRLARVAVRSHDRLWVRLPGLEKNEWVRTSDLATEGGMRRFRHCWPFKQIHPAEGEATFDRVDFALDGTAVLVDLNGRKWASQVFIKDALVWVKPDSKSKAAPFGEFFRMSSDENALEPGAETPSGIVRFEEDLIRRCRENDRDHLPFFMK